MFIIRVTTFMPCVLPLNHLNSKLKNKWWIPTFFYMHEKTFKYVVHGLGFSKRGIYLFGNGDFPWPSCWWRWGECLWCLVPNDCNGRGSMNVTKKKWVWKISPHYKSKLYTCEFFNLYLPIRHCYNTLVLLS